MQHIRFRVIERAAFHSTQMSGIHDETCQDKWTAKLLSRIKQMQVFVRRVRHSKPGVAKGQLLIQLE